MSTQVQVQLFGGLRLQRGQASVDHFRTQKTAGLLAYLAYYHRPHRREALIELFWPDHPEDAGRNSLSTALSALRGSLSALGVTPDSVLQADRGTVRLAPEHVETDVTRFRELLAGARHSAEVGARPEQLAQLEQAVALYHGDLLLGVEADWAYGEQARLALMYRESLTELVRHYQSKGELDAAIEYCLQAVACDPLAPETNARMMRLYLDADRPTLACSHYRLFERRLREELDATPGAEFHELIREALSRPTGKPGEARTAPEAPIPLEPIGGAVAPGSRFYIRREVDDRLEEALAAGESIVLLKGAAQTGKTSLLTRALYAARQRDCPVAFTDLLTLTSEDVSSLDGALRALAVSLAEQLDLAAVPDAAWIPERGPVQNFRRFVRREILARSDRPILWALDEVDRLFAYPWSNELFAVFRSWHNERMADPQGPWSRLTLIFAYATEAHLFITDLHQSPFNVGVRLEVDDFTPAQVSELVTRYGWPAPGPAEAEALAEWVGGHPFLVRRSLHELARRGGSLSALGRLAGEQGLFADHFRRLSAALERDAALVEVMRCYLRAGQPPPETAFLRLRSAGVLAGTSPADTRLRCGVYRQHLERALG